MSARVLVAPDSFKGTMDAPTVAAALADGVRDAGGVPDVCPVADGGEGTLAALRAALGGHLVEVDATAPDGRRVPAHYLLTEDGGTAVVETATASGLHLIDPATVDAFAATSAGTGELLAAVAAAGVRRVLLGVGGSGCSDGGRGALSAIAAAGGLRGARLRVLCDVATPYEDAARVFGPQKGADPATVVRLTDRLHETARSLPRDPRGVPRTGAAGGLAGALWAVHDAELVSGIDAVLHAHGVVARLERAHLVLTGEGRLDAQTAEGKAVAGLTRWAQEAGVPVHAVVGRSDVSPEVIARLGLSGVTEAGDPAALRAAARRATREICPTGTATKEVTTP
ncbi:glycerate kinase [Nocardioides sp. BYT-33-1]|uniref:glycerate kinase n=1 Tax=Nocardioides sp. BYT-33-1 TaxID=3416952 RepID=UPI003F53D911